MRLRVADPGSRGTVPKVPGRRVALPFLAAALLAAGCSSRPDVAQTSGPTGTPPASGYTDACDRRLDAVRAVLAAETGPVDDDVRDRIREASQPAYDACFAVEFERFVASELTPWAERLGAGDPGGR